MRDTHINKQDLINDLKEEIRKLQNECVRYYKIYKGTVEDKNKLFEKNNEAKEIIRECIKHTCDTFCEISTCEHCLFKLKVKDKAEAFLKE